MYDLHTHSNFSDGVFPPEKLVKDAKDAGLTLLAISDHDTAAGLPRALAAAEECGQPFIPAVEIEADFSSELHILGLGLYNRGEKLKKLLESHKERRAERNDRLLKKLADAGMDVYGFMHESEGDINKSNIAQAMVSAGHVSSVGEAFDLYLKRGKPFDVRMRYPDMPEVMDAITEAGGLPVLAHPMKMDCDYRALITDMKAHGLWGIEAYYSTATKDQTEYFIRLAREFDLRPTCGSDYHGPHRPEARLGCAWENSPELLITEGVLKRYFGISASRPTGRFGRVPFGFTAAEFQQAADRVAESLPEDLLKGLTGGIAISENEKLHPKSEPSRPLYILGEYRHGGGEGAYVVLYYGSLRKLKPGLSGQKLEDEVRRVMLHELRHHLETRAGEHDLEDEDAACLAEYLDEGIR